MELHKESKPRVLIVDDEPILLKAMQRCFRTYFDVTCAADGATALRLLSAQPFEVIVCDLRMNGMSGQELHAAILATAPDLAKRMIFVCGETSSPRAKTFLGAIPNAHFEKPVDLDALRARMKLVVGRLSG